MSKQNTQDKKRKDDMVGIVSQRTGDYFNIFEIRNVLSKETNWDVEAAVVLLNHKRQNSWSNVVNPSFTVEQVQETVRQTAPQRNQNNKRSTQSDSPKVNKKKQNNENEQNKGRNGQNAKNGKRTAPNKPSQPSFDVRGVNELEKAVNEDLDLIFRQTERLTGISQEINELKNNRLHKAGNLESEKRKLENEQIELSNNNDAIKKRIAAIEREIEGFEQQSQNDFDDLTKAFQSLQ